MSQIHQWQNYHEALFSSFYVMWLTDRQTDRQTIANMMITYHLI